MLQLSTNSKKETVVNIILIQYGNLNPMCGYLS